MAGIPRSPKLCKPIPDQVVNEGGAIAVINLKNHIDCEDKESGEIRYTAQLAGGGHLPKGIVCAEGCFSGFPAAGTAGHYKIIIIAENNSGIPFSTEFTLTIEPALSTHQKDDQWWTDLKSRVWEALDKNLAVPSMTEMLKRDISPTEILYLLERYATITLWNAYNLEVAGEKKVITLDGVSPHYVIYDRGSCLVGAPKSLFSHERTLEDGLKTARAMAQEVYKREWVIQLQGYDKLTKAAWVELQHLGDKYGRKPEILHYAPSVGDLKVYTTESEIFKLLG